MPLIRKPDNATRNAGTTPTDPAAVLRALTHGNQEERWNAARTAATLDGGIDALVAALPGESDARVREAMFTSLARTGSPQSIGAMINLLRTDHVGLRTGALDALRAMPDALRMHIPALLSDADSDVRVLSCEIVRGLPAAEASAMLCDLLEREPEANVCAAAIDVLTEVGVPAALPVLDRCAERFPQTAFLAFAIRIARDRILAQSTASHD